MGICLFKHGASQAELWLREQFALLPWEGGLWECLSKYGRLEQAPEADSFFFNSVVS